MKRCFAYLLFTGLALTGCKKEEPNPEARDPIYQDLEKRAADAQKSHDEAVPKIKGLRETIAKIAPNSIELKDTQKELAKYEKIRLSAGEAARYYKIRAKRRLLITRLAYKEAFAADRPWPNSHEYSDYLTNERLRQASLNWGARVPKLKDRVAARAPASNPEKPAEGGH